LEAEPLLSLAALVAGERRASDVLGAIVKGIAGQPGVALTRIWLRAPGDLCEQGCFQRHQCVDHRECLHLAASAGLSKDQAEDWSLIEGRYFQRIPMGNRKLDIISVSGKSVLVPDVSQDKEWILRHDWAKKEEIRSFAGHPLIFREKILGIFVLFSRETITEQNFVWLRMFADQAAVAITNAQAFERAEQALEELRKSETKFRSLLDLSPVAIYLVDNTGQFVSANQAGLGLLGCTGHELQGMPVGATYSQEELSRIKTPIEAMGSGMMRFERSFLRRDGSMLTVEVSLSPMLPGGRQVVMRDITDRKRAEDALKEQAHQLQQVIDVAPVHMFIWEADANVSYGNRSTLDYFGPIPRKHPMEFLDLVTHSEDVLALKKGIQEAFEHGEAFETEVRMRRHDGDYRWFLYRLNPLRDEQGRITRWCGVRTDIDDQKRAQVRTQRENIALREEIDKASMFEEIVGTSSALQAVLLRVAKVAPSDTTVLITGETGTGKELIARAIHKRSPRSSRPFVSVNCAAIPRDLIASELFGHEKGAFTGALQRRLGRFELGEGGTIFLDEIGELNAETQVALLRVLQEREFDRVGGMHPIRADVRVITATHRDLPAEVEAGTFRSDLFYRVNVFPVKVPPLRERREDIRLLVEYFIDRYATKAGKKITSIEKKSLAHLQSYPWPGNIRELQNVIERSVILCDSDEFSVDESWLTLKPAAVQPLREDLVDQEKKRIEAALAEAGGRVSGPSGAAAKLGMPASTLDSKIKSLHIDKRRFQTH
jgi:formate hydrogenlyase transcriptional activator